MSEQLKSERIADFAITAKTRDSLRQMQSVLPGVLEGALTEFYATLSRAEGVAHFFRDDAHRDHAKKHQIAHWDSILSGEFDDQYFQNVRRIGEVHCEIGLEPRIYVAGYAGIASNLIRGAMKAAGRKGLFANGQDEKAEAWVDALVRAVFLDMELALSTYLEAGEARAREARNRVADTLEANVSATLAGLAETSDRLDELAGRVGSSVDATLTDAATTAREAQSASQNVQSVVVAAEQMRGAVDEISGQVNQTSDRAREAVDQVGAAAQVMDTLNSAASEIGNIVGLIQDIAEQTNLLALNATIEAARAGEAGAGFAVVAGEVKHLAQQTASATDRISQQIGAVQQGASTAGTAIQNIHGTIEAVNEASVSINAAIEEQSSAIREIVRSANEAASGNTAGAESAAKLETGVRECSQSSGFVKEEATAVRKAVAELREKVHGFLEQTRAEGAA
ncbi:MAG: globin-coupled sensor protein [Alphaproteobacteria bacterium]|uniref:globin-coupled sensor protein n=1 Tax=Maricaulis alexandrii TaxID=2570354 RepID=UPI001108221D|nr:globin-coupled sensor protein [Maricaulis alexandrii]MCR9266303.1 globin-coupled sensor protein [Alphaproteobacteria bacterium]